MAHTRWRSLLDSFLREAHRELRITFTPVPQPEKWLFVVGCYNSGTTLLDKLLGTHPEIASLPDEGQFLTDQLVVDYEIGLPRMWVEREDLFRLTEEDDGPDVGRIKKEWAIRLQKKAPVILEKTPSNGARTRWLQRHFENSYFVGLVRDPYAVAEGIRRKAKPRHRADGWSIEMAARQWLRSNEVLVEDAEHLDRFSLVRYEDLTENPAETLDQILDFVGIESGAVDVAGQSFSIHERSEGVSNLNPQSIGNLSEEDVEVITSIVMPFAERFGYHRPVS